MTRFAALLLILPALAAAAEPPPGQTPLPGPSLTAHTITLPAGPLAFHATVSVTNLPPATGAQARIVTTAYTLDGTDPRTRPVTFAFNGGPGTASLYLHLGGFGPWRVPLADAAPSSRPLAIDNAETWLPFTDLVFIDPPGTGFSRVGGEEARHRFWSVEGDVAGFATVIREWLETQGRVASPVYLAGESYSGIRAPRLVRHLAQAEGIGVSGLILISPLLDYGGRSTAYDPLLAAERLPSEVAAARELRGHPMRGREDVQDAEAYALGDYLLDQARGYADPAAVARTSARVATLTGLDESALRRSQGRIPLGAFLRDADPSGTRAGSAYDPTFTVAEAFPENPNAGMPDPLTDRINPPLIATLRTLLADELHWQPGEPYRLSNLDAFHAWDYGGQRDEIQSVSPLRVALAADPKFHVLVMHGLFDLRTPYLGSVLELGAIASAAGADRVSIRVVPGGHLFYIRDESRAALRDAAREMIAPATQ